MKYLIASILVLFLSCGRDDVPTPTPTVIPSPTTSPIPIKKESKLIVFASPASRLSIRYLTELEIKLSKTIPVTVFVVYGNNFGEPATEKEVIEWKEKLNSHFDFKNDIGCNEYKRYFSAPCVVPATIVLNTIGNSESIHRFIGNDVPSVLNVIAQQ